MISKTTFDYTGGPVTHDGTPIINQNFNLNPLEKRNWWKIGLAAFAGFLAGGIVGGVVAGIGAYCASKTTDISQLLPGEYDTIINWFRTDFTNYFNTLIIEGNNLFASNFSAASLPQLNELQKKLCVLKNFYANVNTDTNMSDGAIDFRLELIEPFITAVEDLIHAKAETIHAQAANTSVNVANYNLSPLVSSQSGIITCTVYTTDRQSIATVASNNSTAATTEKKSNLAWFWFALATGAAVLILSSGDKESEEKASAKSEKA